MADSDDDSDENENQPLMRTRGARMPHHRARAEGGPRCCISFLMVTAGVVCGFLGTRYGEHIIAQAGLRPHRDLVDIHATLTTNPLPAAAVAAIVGATSATARPASSTKAPEQQAVVAPKAQKSKRLPEPRTTSATSGSAASALDGSLPAALRAAASASDLRFVMLTFGNAKVLDHLLNFCSHARKAGTAHVVGAVDRATYTKLAAQRTPAYLTPLAHEAYTLDGATSHSSSSWKRFAEMRTGEVARVVRLGWAVLHTDTDVVWLRDPTPYLMCTAAAAAGEFKDGASFPCAPLQRADVAVSSDNMGPGRALTGGGAYHASGTFNSGILFFRPTASGRRFVQAWHDNVRAPPRGSRFVGKTSDQQVVLGMQSAQADAGSRFALTAAHWRELRCSTRWCAASGSGRASAASAASG